MAAAVSQQQAQCLRLLCKCNSILLYHLSWAYRSNAPHSLQDGSSFGGNGRAIRVQHHVRIGFVPPKKEEASSMVVECIPPAVGTGEIHESRSAGARYSVRTCCCCRPHRATVPPTKSWNTNCPELGGHQPTQFDAKSSRRFDTNSISKLVPEYIVDVFAKSSCCHFKCAICTKVVESDTTHL